MRVLLCHNRYGHAAPSGENVAVDREAELIGGMAEWEVSRWHLRSDDLLQAGVFAKIRAAWDLPGSESRRRDLEKEIQRRSADLLHFHNPWPLFSYDLPRVAHQLGLPTIQSLHNFRLIATNTTWIESGRTRRAETESELHELQRMGANHRGRMVNAAYQRALDSLWREGWPTRSVDAFICLSRFQQERMVAAGIPRERTVVKSNFLDYQGPAGTGAGGYALFAGRLDAAKGIEALARILPSIGLPLWIAGEGPLAPALAGISGVKLLGNQSPQDLLELMANARFLATNSQVYETFGLVLIEALAVGTPCLVPDLGAPPEIIEEGRLGRVFRTGDPDHLADQATRLWNEAPSLRAACRSVFEARYTPGPNRALLSQIYSNVLAGRPPATGIPAS